MADRGGLMKSYSYGFEWKSKIEVLGFPLIHVTFGRDPKTGKVLVSKGIIAIGQIGIGVITLAQAGVGLWFGLGQVMAGWFAIGQAAAGQTVICQVGVGEYVLSQMGYGAHVISMKAADPVAKEYFLRLWHSIEPVIKLIFPTLGK